MLADSGEDALAYATGHGADYAAKIETAQAAAPGARPAASEDLNKVATPTQRTCEDVAALLAIPLARTVKSVAAMTDAGFVLALVRGDHVVNEIKLGKVAGMADYRLATEAEILEHLGSEPGFLGPLGAKSNIRVVADREVAALADFVIGANEAGFHLAGVNWQRDLDEPDTVADIRNVVAGDRAPDGQGTLDIARGIEVGHVFQLGRKYAEAMKCSVLDESGKRWRRRWAVTASASPASSPRRSSRITTTPASCGRRRWRRGKLRSASSILRTTPPCPPPRMRCIGNCSLAGSKPCSTIAACAPARCSPTSN